MLEIKNAHNKFIISIDISNDVIVSCSGSSIRLFSKINGDLLFEKENAHNKSIGYMQFTSNDQLLSSSI